MFNDPLINGEAQQKIVEREREAETYRMHQQLGYSDRRAARLRCSSSPQYLSSCSSFQVNGPCEGCPYTCPPTPLRSGDYSGGRCKGGASQGLCIKPTQISHSNLLENVGEA